MDGPPTLLEAGGPRPGHPQGPPPHQLADWGAFPLHSNDLIILSHSLLSGGLHFNVVFCIKSRYIFILYLYLYYTYCVSGTVLVPLDKREKVIKYFKLSIFMILKIF